MRNVFECSWDNPVARNFSVILISAIIFIGPVYPWVQIKISQQCGLLSIFNVRSYEENARERRVKTVTEDRFRATDHASFDRQGGT